MRNGFLLSLTLAIGVLSCSRAGEQPPAAVYASGYLPTPPQQNQRWTPPRTKLPKVVVDAMKVLFRQGLADPRGCEYREIEVCAATGWVASTVVETHGWVLPGAKGEKQRFAVCWDGLVYPVLSVGKAADLKADVLAAIEADAKRLGEWIKSHPGSPVSSFRTSWRSTGGDQCVSHKGLLPVKAVLLFRLGEGALGQKLWAAWTGGIVRSAPAAPPRLPLWKRWRTRRQKPPDPNDPYLELAGDWTWSLFDRAVTAHRAGDDRLALASVRMLSRIHKAVEAEAARRRFVPPKDNHGKEQPYLLFLRDLPGLLADQERRAKAPRHDHVLVVGLDKFPDRDERIAALIRDLEDAVGWPGVFGGVGFSEDPVVRALVNEGDAAVEPLLDCLEKDDRLTRAVAPGRTGSRWRETKGVHEAAYTALTAILKTDAFRTKWTGYGSRGQRGTAWRKTMAQTIRAHWRGFKGLPLAERWYRTLADDAARPQQWLDAAESIVRPADVYYTPRYRVLPTRKPGEVPKLSGESLRTGKDPSVTQLMLKRLEALFAAEDGQMKYYTGLHGSSRMALCLGKWDPPAALPILRKQTKRCRDYQRERAKVKPGATLDMSREIVSLLMARHGAGDEKALEEYAGWMCWLTRAPEWSTPDIFEPMWRHSEHPAIAAAAQWIFNDEASAWSTLVSHTPTGGAHKLAQLLQTPLVRLPGFRDHLLRRLADTTRVGTVTINERGRLDVRSDTGWDTNDSPLPGDPHLPTVGSRIPFRMCDLYARKLSLLEGTPQCRLYWDEAKRDQAVAACAAFLRRYGPRFGTRPGGDLKLVFEPLERPATPEDVETGLAVFSLAGGGEVRRVPMPTLPITGRWLTLKDCPYESTSYDVKTGKEERGITYHQSGRVIQAEEVLRDGKWERFYGFVGRYCVARAPAGEMDFPNARRGWAPLSRKLDCRITRVHVVVRRAVGEPVTLELSLRNRGGLDQRVPSTYLATDPLALRSGIDLKLQYAPGDVWPQVPPHLRHTVGVHVPDQGDWTELKPRITARFKAADVGKTLAPTEAFVALRLDLRDWFDLSRPGSYQLRFLFTTKYSGFADGQSAPFRFTLSAR